MKKELLSEIKKYEKIIIHRHQKPDGDALGSQLGLAEIIRENFPKKQVEVFGSEIEFENNSIKNIFKSKTNNSLFDEINESSYDNSLVIVTDTANVDRIEGMEFFRGEKIFKIDHHTSTEVYGTYEWVDSDASSTCEMISLWAKGNKLIVSKDAANFLLTGMITDTGRFMFNSVKPETFEAAEFLMQNGAKIHKIVNKLNDRNLNFARIQGFVLSNLNFKNGISTFILPKGTEKKFKVDYNTASSLIFLLMSFKEANYAAYLSYDSKNKIWKGSLRSKKKPINEIAEKFDGGGHQMAAGFKLKDSKQFSEIIEELKKLN